MVNDKLERLQELEQDLEGLSHEREATESQLVQVESALDELDDDVAYKIIGNIMVKKDADDLREELEEERSSLRERFEKLSSQQEAVEEDASALRTELMESMQ